MLEINKIHQGDCLELMTQVRRLYCDSCQQHFKKIQHEERITVRETTTRILMGVMEED